ncbi:MAG: hypothetical protein IPP57_26130 [Candidatus Obscuribacter sp.]|jgi:hypothetical protein|nr:hypothetical protein [Candidatus Obscuribacter sp.]MBL0187999.1 hypothetical protein [Candidatus Obscuribacter sp.]MDQ5966040.1 hypothetical protein [Cyanobacteriota bacterium erpe_2018_sw_39hr_WHONDRS-SW48-000098_B_bin.30]
MKKELKAVALAAASFAALSAPQSVLSQGITTPTAESYNQTYPVSEEATTQKLTKQKEQQKQLSLYEQQEIALQMSQAMYGSADGTLPPAREAEVSRNQTHSNQTNYSQSNYNQANYNTPDYYNQTYSNAPAKASKLRGAFSAATKVLGATAAIAVPVTSIVLLNRAARNAANSGAFSRVSGF